MAAARPPKRSQRYDGCSGLPPASGLACTARTVTLSAVTRRAGSRSLCRATIRRSSPSTRGVTADGHSRRRGAASPAAGSWPTGAGMMSDAVTCRTCLHGRHLRCETKGSCACSICGWAEARPHVPRVRKRRARTSSGGGRHASQATQKVNNIQGRHALAGYSTLSAADQALVAEWLERGETISAIARAVGCSRDQVRTIRNRINGLTHRQARTTTGGTE